MTNTKMSRGRCYCGATAFSFSGEPNIVALCHCRDCRRWTGAPTPTFAAFDTDTLTTDIGPGRIANPGVHRWNCTTCGSPIAATFDYLPGQMYVPVGVLDDADTLSPQVQCHSESALKWVHLDENVPQAASSARDMLMSHSDGKDRS